MNIIQIAELCHEANRAYCRLIGDNSQLPWADAPDWQRQSAISGVEFCRDNPEAPVFAQHQAWLKGKLADGWKYGTVKSPEKKEHPCCVPYEELPEEQKVKDTLFVSIVKVFAKE